MPGYILILSIIVEQKSYFDEKYVSKSHIHLVTVQLAAFSAEAELLGKGREENLFSKVTTSKEEGLTCFVSHVEYSCLM